MSCSRLEQFVDKICESVYDGNLCLVTPLPHIFAHRQEGNTTIQRVLDVPAVT